MPDYPSADEWMAQLDASTPKSAPPPANDEAGQWMAQLDAIRAGNLTTAEPDIEEFGKRLSRTAAVRTPLVQADMEEEARHPLYYQKFGAETKTETDKPWEVATGLALAKHLGEINNRQTVADAWDAVKGLASYGLKISQQPQSDVSLA